MKLELGCGRAPTPGYVHHDRWAHAPHVELSFDLNVVPWPIADDSVEHLRAIDVFEHLDVDVRVWLDECHRILQSDGILVMRLPAYDNPLSFRDPTHKRLFHPQSFLYWCPQNPGMVWQEFGRYYFGPDYRKWWKQLSMTYEHSDLLFTLVKDLS
jgi:hypothetical protein